MQSPLRTPPEGTNFVETSQKGVIMLRTTKRDMRSFKRLRFPVMRIRFRHAAFPHQLDGR